MTNWIKLNWIELNWIKLSRAQSNSVSWVVISLQIKHLMWSIRSLTTTWWVIFNIKNRECSEGRECSLSIWWIEQHASANQTSVALLIFYVGFDCWRVRHTYSCMFTHLEWELMQYIIEIHSSKYWSNQVKQRSIVKDF